MRIFIKALLPISFQIEPSDTVEDVEAKIEAIGMGSPLNDKWKSKLKPETPIFVEIFSVKSIELELDTSDTMGTIKSKLQDLTDTLPDEQTIVFAGKSLEDHRSLADYNIGRDSTFHMILRVSLISFDFF